MESPNKEGKNNPVPVTVRDLARRHTLLAVRQLAHNVKHGRTGSVQNQAAAILLAYGWGRPPQSVQFEAPEGASLAAVVIEAYSHGSKLLDNDFEVELVSGRIVRDKEPVEALPAPRRRQYLED